MSIFTIIVWASATVMNPNLGEIGFDKFRQSINQKINEHLKSVNENPLDSVEYFNLGLAYMAIGQHRLEVNSYLEAIRLNSNYPTAHFNLAMAYDILKEGKSALNHAKKAEILYAKQRKHRQVRKVRRQLNIFYKKYGMVQK